MTFEQFANLVRIGQLKQEAPDKIELQGLVHSGKVRLSDAHNTSLNPESRFDLAYNAAHSLALAALRAKGYRSENRYLVFQCLQHTLDLPSHQWRVLDTAHRKRNLAEYEGSVEVDDQLLDSLLRVADQLLGQMSEVVASETKGSGK
ncbi:hypothetical protein SAMN05660443_2400 [Marinospirillum celere]|uniref:SAV-6107-like HEPN domain-containing protein n=1 Tax=Marinospirillum celere TaxID=1122252 RepID=A0A1I1IM60_9GAMM|nr:hypothetical protein [Marinospirillum celere]SFC37354.1 hypothetical protein SAMN05660443_2400 [Marinospirillum celere]